MRTTTTPKRLSRVSHKTPGVRYRDLDPDERRRLERPFAEALQRLVLQVRTARRDLAGCDDPDDWRLVLELLKATRLELTPDEFGELPMATALQILRAAAAMKGDQQAAVLQAVRAAMLYPPKPGTRAAKVLVALWHKQAFDKPSLVSITNLLPAVASYSSPDSFKAVVGELRVAGFIHTQTGRAGGLWLSELGKSVAEHLAEKR